MKVYLVFSMAKTGSSSIFKLLTENGKFPALHTHAGSYLTVHDTLNLDFQKTCFNEIKIHFTDRFRNGLTPY